MTTRAHESSIVAAEHRGVRDERSMLVLEIVTAAIALGSVLLLALGR